MAEFQRQVDAGWRAFFTKRGLPLPMVPKEQFVFTEEELKRFLAAADGDRDERLFGWASDTTQDY